jgi:hypothetical protein
MYITNCCQVEEFRAAYEESERTHRLRDQSDSALKEEVAKQKVWKDTVTHGM